MENQERRPATDMELVLGLIPHIENPCKDPAGNDIREFYIREAQKLLPTMTNPDAKAMLEEAISKYSNPNV